MAKNNFIFCNISYLICILNFALLLIEAAPKSSLVTHLPGFNGTFPSKHYSGYVTIEGGKASSTPKNLFYYFVVSERRPSKDPVVLWLNGGPGCSSFDGFVYEHGPFNFKEAKKEGQLPTLHLNPYSWSKVSSVIYLDSPTGVGFSYSKNKSEYYTDDTETASDTHKFLLKWFEQYPEFKSNPFYIAGESFAGIYVPTLSSEIVKGIKAGAKPVINFKGYMIGNAVTDENFDGDAALFPFAHGMGLISDDMYENVIAACKGNDDKETCRTAQLLVNDALFDLNIYNILEPCYHSKTAAMSEEDGKGSKNLPSSFKNLGATERPLPVRRRMFGRAWPFRAPVKAGIVPSWPKLMSRFSSYAVSVPCINDVVANIWLNDASVRKAMHTAPASEIGPWDLCTSKVIYSHNTGSMLSYHKNLTMQGYRALIYSGDHDMCVPYTGSEAWTRSLGYKIVDKWRTWIIDDQVAGYLQAYDHNLTFLTIKGSGHTVPEYKPKEALGFYSRWLAEEAI
ncbi:serine carboxypeptidase-like 20 [Mangifera indica]|uniref:serine carboxypeptidase-like 20 n=1 Tax=Mangifera indica TaxID=29780 RepID=UPI001CFAFFF9|nr:serine carboxypeptidase-like 20 [Mangifera indica]